VTASQIKKLLGCNLCAFGHVIYIYMYTKENKNMTLTDLRRASTQQIAGLNFVKDSYPFEDELKNQRKPLDRF